MAYDRRQKSVKILKIFSQIEIQKVFYLHFSILQMIQLQK